MLRILLLAVFISAPAPAEAGLGSLFKLAAKAGKAGAKGAKGAKIAKGAAVAGKAGGLIGGMTLAERAGLSLTKLPDDVVAGASYVARESDGLKVLSHTDEGFRAGKLADEGAVVLDPSAALDAKLLDDLDGRALYTVDADGALHAVKRTPDGFEVDGLDLAEFAIDQFDLVEEEEDEVSDLVAGLVGAGVVGALIFVAVRRKRQAHLQS